MKLSLGQYDITYTISTANDDQNVKEMFEFFENLMLSAGYTKESIIKHYQEWRTIG